MSETLDFFLYLKKKTTNLGTNFVVFHQKEQKIDT